MWKLKNEKMSKQKIWVEMNKKLKKKKNYSDK